MVADEVALPVGNRGAVALVVGKTVIDRAFKSVEEFKSSVNKIFTRELGAISSRVNFFSAGVSSGFLSNVLLISVSGSTLILYFIWLVAITSAGNSFIPGTTVMTRSAILTMIPERSRIPRLTLIEEAVKELSGMVLKSNSETAVMDLPILRSFS